MSQKETKKYSKILVKKCVSISVKKLSINCTEAVVKAKWRG